MESGADRPEPSEGVPVVTTPETERPVTSPQGHLPVTVRSVAETVANSPLTKEILRAPFTRRSYHELAFVVVGAGAAGIGFAFVALGMSLGVGLAVTFIGLAVFALAIRGARGVARLHRNLARALLNEVIAEPEPFSARPGFFGWLQSALRDRVGWRAVAYIALKVPVAIAGVYFGFSIWWDALACFIYPFKHFGNLQPSEFGIIPNLFPPGFLSIGNPTAPHDLGVLVTGAFLLFLAPWPVRLIVSIDRRLMGALIGPDPVSVRVRSLEQARAHTVDASAATLRRIERDLHDGTQAQLVALAMRLGLAKEKLEGVDDVDLDGLRALVDEAHKGAKEAIVELRDLARGIHPPALDVGLEGALATLAARSTVPTELAFSLNDRPTPAIEAIAYFCVAELLSNVAQHARASRATIRCSRNGGWLRLVVRDDGVGGAQLSRLGSSSSGLAGLVDRVRAVDGRLDIVSPPHGPTVITVDLPMHA